MFLYIKNEFHLFSKVKNRPTKYTIVCYKLMVIKISGDQEKIAELNEKIKSLEEEMEFLKEDLEAADDEVEKYEQKIQIYESGKALFYTRDEVLKKIKNAIDSALHTINVTAPTIQDVGELYLFEVNANVNVKVASNLNLSDPKDKEILGELEAFDNIDLRIYDGMDRWSALIDGEKIIFGALGSEKDHILLFQTEDPKQITIFNNLAIESWLRGKKLKD